MKVVFLEQVEGTANPGDVKDVANGFARNYLLPRGLAVPAGRSALERAESLAKKEERRQSKLDQEATISKEKLDGAVLTFAERVGEQGRLFGSVTVSHIAARIGELTGGDFDRHKVLLPESLRELGRHEVRLRLSRNVDATVVVEVVAAGGQETAAAATPEAPVEEPDVVGDRPNAAAIENELADEDRGT